MTQHAYYSVAASPPPIGVAVLVIWDGRPAFEAARVNDPRVCRGQRARTCWLTHDGGRAVLLPTDSLPPDPRRPWAGWHTLRGDAPDYWRPLHPDRWRLQLPAPAYVETPAVAGRMWSSTTRRPGAGATALEQVARVGIDGMSAAELAREMEEMREEARAQGRAAPERAEPQWWLDPHAVTYSAPGAITMREAEGRLMRAFAAEWWVRVEWPRMKTAAQVLANMAKSLPLPGEAAAQDPIITRPEPTGRDQDDMLEALGWLRILGGAWKRRLRAKSRNDEVFAGGAETTLERRLLCMGSDQEAVLRLRGSSPPLTWARIGNDVGRSAEAARGLYRAALAEVTAAANGGPTPEVEAVRAERSRERERLNALKARKRSQQAGRAARAAPAEG